MKVLEKFIHDSDSEDGGKTGVGKSTKSVVVQDSGY